MVPAHALLLGIPVGAALGLAGTPALIGVWLCLILMLSPRPAFRWRVMVVFGLAIGLFRAGLVPAPLALPEGRFTVTATVRDVRESWLKTRYFLTDAATTNGQALGAVVATVRSAEADAGPGDQVTIVGSLLPPTPYLAAQGLVASLEDARVTVAAPGPFSLGTGLARLRRETEQRLSVLLPLPESALLSGLLLGTDERLPHTDSDNFRAAGLSHLTAVSGSNVALILSLMGRALWWVPRRWQLLPLALGIGGFTLLVGAPASAVRAALTGVVGLIALQGGRPAGGRRALILALAAMTLWEPRQLIADAGFQLSFLATLGIVELGPPLKRLCERWLPTFLAEATAVTLAAELPTLPWSAWIFGTFSTIAPFTNLVAAPLSGLATMGGLALLGTSLLLPPLTLLVRPVAWLGLHALIALAHVGATLGALLPDPGPPPLPLLLCLEGGLLAAALLWSRLSAGTATPSGDHAMLARPAPPRA